MGISNFDGKTFVAFIDIAGFKKMMKNRQNALRALDTFYKAGYEVLKNQNEPYKVEGLFVSDCGILFVRGQDAVSQLIALLNVVKAINERMLEKDYMLTTSIAYGDFTYQERITFRGIEKNLIYGFAYVDAFLDNENGRPKIRPGQCRIVKRNLPEKVENAIQKQEHRLFKLIRQRKGDRDHYYFYWNCKDPSEIEIFERNYSNAQEWVYRGMLKALKGEYWLK